MKNTEEMIFITPKFYKKYVEKSVYDGRTYKERDGIFSYCEDQLTIIAAAPITQTKCDFPEAVGVDECAFNGCSMLYEVNLPSVCYVEEWAFSDCRKLEIFPAMSKITVMRYGAFCNSGIKKADLSSLLNIPFAAFSNCKELETVKFNENLRSIGEDAFASCAKLREVQFPESLKEIGQYSFFGTGIEEISIPKRIKAINDGVFGACESLRSVTIPNGVESIGDCAFIGCDKLKSVFLPLSINRIHEDAFSLKCLKTVICVPGSYAESWAKKKGFAVKFV